MKAIINLFGTTKITHVIRKSQPEGHGCNNIHCIIHWWYSQELLINSLQRWCCLCGTKLSEKHRCCKTLAQMLFMWTLLHTNWLWIYVRIFGLNLGFVRLIDNCREVTTKASDVKTISFVWNGKDYIIWQTEAMVFPFNTAVSMSLTNDWLFRHVTMICLYSKEYSCS